MATPESLATASAHEELMARFFDAFKRRSVDDILAMVTDDAVLESAFGPEVHGKRFTGKAAFREGLVRYFEVMAGARTCDRTYSVLGDKGFTEVTVSFTDAEGKEVTTRVCDIFDFRDGKVASKRAYAKRIVAG
jgi:ketosteroid isomerase-like protein